MTYYCSRFIFLQIALQEMKKNNVPDVWFMEGFNFILSRW
jgi:hypothetical protein